MREEQRQIRSEQRRIRSELRSTRRERVRSESNALREQLGSKIASLEENLAHVDEKYDTLAVEIESQYDDLRDDRDGFTKTNAPEAPDLDKLIAQTACDYGATLKSLPDSNFLTIMLQRGDGSQVYSFRMDDVRRCSDRDISIDKLLSNSYQYAG